MSAHLGPIHYRMYAKAQAVHALAVSIAHHADDRGWTDGLAARLASEAPTPAGELESTIDLANIHASLNGLVGEAERALALVMSQMASHLDDVCVYARDLGGQLGGQLEGSDPALVWNAMDASWLDGMPCDRCVTVLANDPGQIDWSIEMGVHPAEGYGELRTAWMEGFATAAGLSLARLAEGTFRLTKED
ncbi:hypothetical protein HLV35_02220 [Eggerthellaceae bacterium zg-997]|nr:hypothetical protein [Eggerthellaceae bacterium zg-997]